MSDRGEKIASKTQKIVIETQKNVFRQQKNRSQDTKICVLRAKKVVKR